MNPGNPSESATPAAASEPLVARLLKRYLCIAILIGVAAFQMYRVQTDGLTPWKGGGFGMYSVEHPEDDELWVEFRRPNQPTRFLRVYRPQSLEGRAILQRVKEFPTAESLRELHGTLAPGTGKLELWRPQLDPATLVYERKLFASYDPDAEAGP